VSFLSLIYLPKYNNHSLIGDWEWYSEICALELVRGVKKVYCIVISFESKYTKGSESISLPQFQIRITRSSAAELSKLYSRKDSKSSDDFIFLQSDP